LLSKPPRGGIRHQFFGETFANSSFFPTNFARCPKTNGLPCRGFRCDTFKAGGKFPRLKSTAEFLNSLLEHLAQERSDDESAEELAFQNY